VAIIDQVEADGKTFVRLESGGWVQAKPIYSWIRFQGLVFSQTPENDFGWAVDEAEIYSAPGYNSPKTGKSVAKYEVIQIYQVAQADGYEWYLIGPNAWVSSHKSRRVVVDTTKPEGVTGNRWIKIDLANFTLSAYEDGELVFATLVSTGLPPMYTRPGLFQIYERYEASPMFGATRADRSDYYYLEAVPWTMYYDDTRGIHGVYWPIILGYNQSHGCVNLAPGDANWLYAWAKLGDWVYVVDPSGKTPTDPAYYLGVTAGP
jgi:lipoprotein-anchoring transpeptidase ErfK/SrfK